MGQSTIGCFTLVVRIMIHILLSFFTGNIILLVMLELISPLFAFLWSFVIVFVCSYMTLICLAAILQTTRTSTFIFKKLFGLEENEAKLYDINTSLHFFSVLNFYLICNTVVIVAMWLVFSSILTRAEPLAYILTILSGLSGYGVRQLKKRLDTIDTTHAEPLTV